jgi:HIRAN domain
MARAFHSKIAGVTAKNDNGRSRQDYIRAFCTAGMPLQLVREPKNPFDKNAVGLWIKARALIFFTSNVQIGYLGRDVAGEIAPRLDRGDLVHAEISDVTGGGSKNFGVNILITLPS